MAKKFKDLMGKMSPRAQARARLKAALVLSEIELAELRKASSITQTEVAAILGVSQASVSGFESGRDMMVGTLKKYVEALGGELIVSAKFPEGEVALEARAAE